jgi:hypothetical protein
VPPTPLVLLTNVLLNMVVFVELIDKMAPAWRAEKLVANKQFPMLTLLTPVK